MILMLKNDSGEWVDDQQTLQSMGVDFFRNLYEDDHR